MRKCGLACLVGAFALGSAISLFGQINFGITPIRVEHAGKPGESITEVFYVRNNGSTPVRLKVFCENWMMKEDGTAVFIGAQPTSYACLNWIRINPQDFRLNPNEIKTVRYTVTIPPDTPAAGYHASVSFETVPDTKTPNTGSRMFISGKIAAVVYVKVGQVPIEGDVLDVKLAQKGDSQALILTVINSGKMHFRLKGGIEVFDSKNNKALEIKAPDEVVLPESQREVACMLSQKLAPGTYRVLCRLDIGREEILGLEKTVRVEK